MEIPVTFTTVSIALTAVSFVSMIASLIASNSKNPKYSRKGDAMLGLMIIGSIGFAICTVIFGVGESNRISAVDSFDADCWKQLMIFVIDTEREVVKQRVGMKDWKEKHPNRPNISKSNYQWLLNYSYNQATIKRLFYDDIHWLDLEVLPWNSLAS